MKAFVVTSGQYSDYRIQEVFLDRAMAEEYVRLHNEGTSHYDEAGIEEWDVAETSPVKLFSKQVSLNQAKDRIEESAYESVGVGIPGRDERVKVEITPTLRGFFLRVEGTDEQAVNQSYSDRRAQIIHDLTLTIP